MSRRCPKKVIELANQVLQQAEPQRINFLQPLPEAIEGHMRFVSKDFQEEEFSSVIADISYKIKAGAKPQSFLILVPKKRFGQEFADFSNAHKESFDIPFQCEFSFLSRPEFSSDAQKRLLLLALIVHPDSVLHMRSCLGSGDQSHYAKEFSILKKKYGGLNNAFARANQDDFPSRKIRVRSLCERITKLKEYLQSFEGESSIDEILNKLFSVSGEYAPVRSVFNSLREEDDTINSLYSKFIDYISTLPADDNTIRVMTIMTSKGLDAAHVYIIGCNDGNLPGENRSDHLNDIEYRNEQLRLLFVGITRAKQTLFVSWSRYLPFKQARQHHTQSVQTIKKNGKIYSIVGLSSFLQNLSGIVWER